jgi:hypothetical protein
LNRLCVCGTIESLACQNAREDDMRLTPSARLETIEIAARRSWGTSANLASIGKVFVIFIYQKQISSHLPRLAASQSYIDTP